MAQAAATMEAQPGENLYAALDLPSPQSRRQFRCTDPDGSRTELMPPAGTEPLIFHLRRHSVSGINFGNQETSAPGRVHFEGFPEVRGRWIPSFLAVIHKTQDDQASSATHRHSSIAKAPPSAARSSPDVNGDAGN